MEGPLAVSLPEEPQISRLITSIPHGQNTWRSPQKVGEYKAYINQYKVTVPSTFTLV